MTQIMGLLHTELQAQLRYVNVQDYHQLQQVTLQPFVAQHQTVGAGGQQHAVLSAPVYHPALSAQLLDITNVW